MIMPPSILRNSELGLLHTKHLSHWQFCCDVKYCMTVKEGEGVQDELQNVTVLGYILLK